MPELSPAPGAYGWSSPVLGDWFAETGPELGDPSIETLAIALSGRWTFQAPAAGILSLYDRTREPHHELARLRRCNGSPAFPRAEHGQVFLFRLLPEVEERLHRLSAFLPSFEAGAEAIHESLSPEAPRRRARVRWFALGFNSNLDLVKIATSLGLTGADAATLPAALGFRGTPIAVLRKPGSAGAVIHESDGDSAELWTFDAHGRPLDPGAVATWFSRLCEHFTNLRHSSGSRRVAQVARGCTLQLVNAHEAGLSAEFVSSRLLVQDARVSTDVVVVASGECNVGLVADPDPGVNAAPVRAALLPTGPYRALTSDTPLHFAFPFERDFVRVGVVELEPQLVGLRRMPSGADLHGDRDQMKHQHASTRVGVLSSTGDVFCTHIEQGIQAALDLYRDRAADVAVRLVAGGLDRDFGPLVRPNRVATEPAELPNVLRVVDAGGSTDEATVSILACAGAPTERQQVLVQVNLGAALRGAWVRVWLQGFELRVGRRVRLHGGAGFVNAEGIAYVVAELPRGATESEAACGLDVVVVTASSARTYADLRFRRPAFVDASARPFPTSRRVVVCENGQVLGDGDLIPSGCQLVALESDPAPCLVDPASVPIERLAEDTLVRVLRATDSVELTQPLRLEPDAGVQTADELAVRLAYFHRFARTTSGRPTEAVDDVSVLVPAGAPPPDVERLEVVFSRLDANDAFGVLLTAPALRRYHQLPRGEFAAPHGLAPYVGAPAAAEYHGTGLRLRGPAALALDTFAFERSQRWTVDLVQANLNRRLPTLADAAGPLRWVSLLRTVKAGVEIEAVNPGVSIDWAIEALLPILRSLLDEGFRLDDLLPPQVAQALDPFLNTVDPSATYDVLRRRLWHGLNGSHDAYVSLLAALARAEDLVYVETPDLGFAESAGDEVPERQLWQILKQRLDERPGLQVALCIATDVENNAVFLPATGQPTRDGIEIRRDRRRAIASAVELLGNLERVAIFSPAAGSGRSVHFASTTVVVDDAYALTGNTHLSGSGLQRDASLAGAVFDDELTDGRPHRVRAFRTQLIADRLGILAQQVPPDPAELVAMLRNLVRTGGAGRLASEPLLEPVENT